MKRLGLVAGLLGLAAASVCLAGAPTNRFIISTGTGGYLAVRKGELFLRASPTWGAVADTEDASDRWYILGTQIKSSVGGGYLVYDPNGEDNAVVLKSKPDKDAEWMVDVPGKGHRSEGKRAVIRAASGRKKGWYLTLEQTEIEEDGRRVPIRYLALSKDPPLKLQAARIFSHK